MPESKDESIAPASESQMPRGLTAKQYAAILLRIPKSGETWLDEMIVEAKNRDIAVQVVSGMLSTQFQDPHAGNQVIAIAEPIIKELQKR